MLGLGLLFESLEPQRTQLLHWPRASGFGLDFLVYVCMYVCMYVYLYIYMHSMYMDRWIDRWIDGQIVKYIHTYKLNHIIYIMSLTKPCSFKGSWYAAMSTSGLCKLTPGTENYKQDLLWAGHMHVSPYIYTNASIHVYTYVYIYTL